MEEAGGFGTLPLVDGPARALGGIAVGDVDLCADAAASLEEAIGAGEGGDGLDIGRG